MSCIGRIRSKRDLELGKMENKISGECLVVSGRLASGDGLSPSTPTDLHGELSDPKGTLLYSLLYSTLGRAMGLPGDYRRPITYIAIYTYLCI